MGYKFKRLRENEYAFSDFIFPAIVVVLMVIGYFVLKSVVSETNLQLRLERQVLWNILGLCTIFYFVFETEQRLKRMLVALYFLSVVLLVLVLLFGKEVYGAKRWLDIGPFDLQPSELFKLALIPALAEIFSRLDGWRAFVVSVVAVTPATLIFIEPDAGMTLLMTFLWFTLLLASSTPFRYVLAVVASGVLAAPIVFFGLLKDYQRARILAIFNPEEHFHTAAYNTIMSQAAVANGGLKGTGYGLGTATNLKIVPMQHTDFIFSAYAEQFGLIGSLILVGLYGIMIVLATTKLGRLKDNYWKYVTVGACAVFAFHVFENVGMSIGILPVTGIPLPFISYGGTSTIVFCALVGLMMKARMVSREPKEVNL